MSVADAVKQAIDEMQDEIVDAVREMADQIKDTGGIATTLNSTVGEAFHIVADLTPAGKEVLNALQSVAMANNSNACEVLVGIVNMVKEFYDKQGGPTGNNAMIVTTAQMQAHVHENVKLLFPFVSEELLDTILRDIEILRVADYAQVAGADILRLVVAGFLGFEGTVTK